MAIASKKRVESVAERHHGVLESLPAAFSLLVNAGGIFIFFILVSFTKELLLHGKSRSNLIPIFLLATQFTGAGISSLVYFLVNPSEYRYDIHPFTFLLPSLTYVAANLMSIYSLMLIDFPTQIMLKSSKPMAVVAVSMLFGIKYDFRTYISVLITVSGLILFKLPSDMNISSFTVTWETLLGVIVVGISLFFDGLNGTIPEKMKKENKFNAQQSLLFYNAFSVVFLVLLFCVTAFALGKAPDEEFGLIAKSILSPTRVVQGGEGGIFEVYRGVLLLMVFVSSFSCGQVFIFRTINEFGSLTTTMITSSRKMISVVLSLLIFSKKLPLYSWIGIPLVMVGIFIHLQTDHPSNRKLDDVKDVEKMDRKVQ